MNIKDYLNTSLLLLCRKKKKIIYTIVILLCTIISMGILIFTINFEKLLNRQVTGQIGFRTIGVFPRETSEPIERKEKLKKDFDDILKIEHVIDVFEKEQEIYISKSSLSNNNLDGAVTLYRAIPETLPTIVEGRAFEKGETGVAICPTLFYPSSNPTLVNRNYLIDGKTLLGKTFTVYYHNYIKGESGELQENETFNKTFKIIGLYDVSERLNDNSICYISSEDNNEILTIQNSWNNTPAEIENENGTSVSTSEGFRVVVDHIDNVDTVIAQIEELGFQIAGLGFIIDKQEINIIYIAIILILFLSLITTILITISYVKKKINNEEENIAILRTSGYSKKIVRNIYTLETLIHNLFIYIIGALLVLLIFLIGIKTVPFLVGADLVLGLEIGILPFMFSFITIVIFPVLTTSYNVIKKCNSNIITLVESEE